MLFLSGNNPFLFSETTVWTKKNFKVLAWQARIELLPVESYCWWAWGLLIDRLQENLAHFSLNHMLAVRGCRTLTPWSFLSLMTPTFPWVASRPDKGQ